MDSFDLRPSGSMAVFVSTVREQKLLNLVFFLTIAFCFASITDSMISRLWM